MNDTNNDAFEGALAGGLTSLIYAHNRNEDDTQLRIRDARRVANDAADAVDRLRARGEMIRLNVAILQDLLTGVLVANPRQPNPTALPSGLPTSVRPQFSQWASETAASNLTWPPAPGQYDANGQVLQIGELGTLGAALTLEEVRAFLLGLTQNEQPSSAAKVQIFQMAHMLVETVAHLNLTAADFRAAWERVFAVFAGGADASPHANTTPGPVITNKIAALSSVTALGAPDIGSMNKHQNTDAASKWRITVGGGNINANTTLFTLQYNSSYYRGGQLYNPVTLLSSSVFSTIGQSPSQVSIVNNVQLAGNTDYDLGIVTVVG